MEKKHRKQNRLMSLHENVGPAFLFSVLETSRIKCSRGLGKEKAKKSETPISQTSVMFSGHHHSGFSSILPQLLLVVFFLLLFLLLIC